MKINKILLQSDGFIRCRSSFYLTRDSINYIDTYEFTSGYNEMIGEIDSGIWAPSYLLSMYTIRPTDFISFENTILTVNERETNLKDFSKYTCYLDEMHPLFSTSTTVEKKIARGLKKSNSEKTAEEIREMFELTPERFDRPLRAVGNERYRAMAAIGYAYGKEVFCMPWFSSVRIKYFRGHFQVIKSVLEKEQKIFIFPHAPCPSWDQSEDNQDKCN